jgi:hypothetical protein
MGGPGRPPKDMQGLVVGTWTVGTQTKGPVPGVFWACRCSCGRERVINGVRLRQKPPLCDCQRDEYVLAKGDEYCVTQYVGRTKDLDGKIYGDLTVIGRVVPVRLMNPRHRGGARWLCLCSCGNRVTIRAGLLNMNVPRMCGGLKNHRPAGTRVL